MNDIESNNGIEMIIGGDSILGVRHTQNNNNNPNNNQINYQQINFIENEFNINPLLLNNNNNNNNNNNANNNTEDIKDDFQIDTFDAVTNFIVPINKKDFFQNWLVESYDEVSLFKGFLSRHVHEISQRDGYIEYVTINIFKSYSTFKEWYTSSERMKLLNQLKSVNIQWSMMNAYGGNIEDVNISPKSKNSHKLTNRITLQNSSVKIPKPMPPPKWKLTILLIVSIYIIVVSYVYSGQGDLLYEYQFPKPFIYFVFVVQVVIINVYALAPLVMEIPFIDTWLRMKRPDPESMHPIHAVLDQGLKMFAVKISPPPHPDITRRLDTLERKIEKLREVEHKLKIALKKSSIIVETQENEEEEEFESLINPLTDLEMSLDRASKSFTRRRSNSDMTVTNNHPSRHKITMAVRHYVKWERALEFEDWVNQMEAEMHKWPGFLGYVRIVPQKEGDPYINSFSFDTIENLIAFSKSPERIRLLKKLSPLLEGTSASEINQERVLNDAFTELFVATGGSVKSRPPPLWKTTILTIIPLHLEVWFIGGNLQRYFLEANLNPYLISFIKLTIHITINSYIGVPLMFSQFGDWIHMERPLKPLGYLSFLDKGLPNRWIRILVLTIYIGLNLLGGFLHRYQF